MRTSVSTVLKISGLYDQWCPLKKLCKKLGRRKVGEHLENIEVDEIDEDSNKRARDIIFYFDNLLNQETLDQFSKIAVTEFKKLREQTIKESEEKEKREKVWSQKRVKKGAPSKPRKLTKDMPEPFHDLWDSIEIEWKHAVEQFKLGEDWDYVAMKFRDTDKMFEILKVWLTGDKKATEKKARGLDTYVREGLPEALFDWFCSSEKTLDWFDL